MPLLLRAPRSYSFRKELTQYGASRKMRSLARGVIFVCLWRRKRHQIALPGLAKNYTNTKRMKIIILSSVVFFLLFAITFLRYRLAYATIVRSASEVNYNGTAVAKNDYFRHSFESLLGKKRVLLKKKLKNAEWIYMTKRDYAKLHPENYLKLKDRHNGVKFKFETQYLVFGGLSAAKLITYEAINEKD